MTDTLQKEVIRQGNGTDKPKAGDTVTMDYTGWLYEAGQPENRGKQYVLKRLRWSFLAYMFRFDSSKDRGEFETKIGVKKVIQGMSPLHDYCKLAHQTI